MFKQITFVNNLNQIPLVSDFIEQIMQELKISSSQAMSINLAIEEAVANVIMYAYPANETNNIQLSASLCNNELIFILTDSGIPFNPTLEEDPNINLPAQDRQIGGLGIMLIKKIMNKVTYEYINGTNQLTMIKTI